MGSCPKPYFRNDHHPKTLETKRIPVLNRIIHQTQSIPLRTAEYETRTLGGVRGALRSYLGAEPSTRLAIVFLLIVSDSKVFISCSILISLAITFPFSSISKLNEIAII